MVNSRGKGAEGEREFCRWLKQTLKLSFLPQRNLEQVRSGGSDVVDIHPFIFEVKRCQGLSLKEWWAQVCTDTPDNKISVVAFRQNRQPWRFLISARLIGLDKGFMQLEEHVFIPWLKKHFVDQ